MFCAHCGHQNSVGARFCARCVQPLRAPDSFSPVFWAAPPIAMPAPAAAPPKKHSWGARAVPLVLALLLAAFAVSRFALLALGKTAPAS